MKTKLRYNQDIEKTFLEAEQTGLRVAIKGRIAALILLGGFLSITRIGDLSVAFGYMGAAFGFSLLGLAHYHIIASRFDRSWVKYIFVTIDFAVLSILLATQPLYDSTPLPQVMMFRTSYFPFYFVILGMAAFGLSPRLVLWAGFSGVVGWLGAFTWAIRNMPNQLDWSDIGSNPTTERFVSIFLNPNFVGMGSRVQESFAYIIVALLIAVVIWRARKTVYRQLELDDQRRTITEVFAQYVPEEIANSLIADRGLLEPVERKATVLFLDIANFTSMMEKVGPKQTVTILNDFFEQCTNCISSNNGVVTQFIGDAVMATFNMPIEDPEHEQHAINAAQQLLELVETRKFDGHPLSIRIGIATGTVIGGSVGGGGRQCYTVYGDTVNLASRLESLNKEYHTNVLVSETTISAMSSKDFKEMGHIDVRGLSKPVSVYTLT